MYNAKVQQMLTEKPWRDTFREHEVRIHHARIHRPHRPWSMHGWRPISVNALMVAEVVAVAAGAAIVVDVGLFILPRRLIPIEITTMASNGSLAVFIRQSPLLPNSS